MRRNSLVVLVTLLGIGLAACDTPVEPTGEDLNDPLSLSVTGGAASWADLAGSSIQVGPSSGTASVQLVQGGDGLTIHTSRADFRANARANRRRGRFEDFEGSNSLFVDVCPGPINHLSNDACYSPEEIVEGISVDNLDAANDPDGMVVIVGGLFTATTVVGPNSFLDDTEIALGYGGASLTSFGIFTPLGACLIRLSVYGSGGLLGAFDIQTVSGSGGIFVGIISEALMTRFTIEDLDPDFCAELVDDVTALR